MSDRTVILANAPWGSCVLTSSTITSTGREWGSPEPCSKSQRGRCERGDIPALLQELKKT